ncbi:MAG: hypothetical protein HF978_10215 [Desulfobacteraceae bacterium]|nr:hypothetical protein [Desulfobacteraceae bacterium]MBC2755911.1 hypothetical protein [Desulfobacteraceae bacterium]
MKRAKNISVIICDDVREEKGGKRSFMGIYGDNIIVKEIPKLLPQLHVVFLVEEIKEPFSDIRLEVKMPEAKPVVMKFKVPVLEVGKNWQISIGIVPFKIEKEGDGIFEIYFDKDKKPSKIHKIKLIKHVVGPT